MRCEACGSPLEEGRLCVACVADIIETDPKAREEDELEWARRRAGLVGVFPRR